MLFKFQMIRSMWPDQKVSDHILLFLLVNKMALGDESGVHATLDLCEHA